MTQEEILQYNKICAKLLGFKYHEGSEYWTTMLWGGAGFTLRQMKFHSDWNWIMAVVEAIEKVNFTQVPEFSCFTVVIKDNRCLIKQNSQFALAFGELSDSFDDSNPPFLIHDSKKEAVVEAINQFLIWYEQQNK